MPTFTTKEIAVAHAMTHKLNTFDKYHVAIAQGQCPKLDKFMSNEYKRLGCTNKISLVDTHNNYRFSTSNKVKMKCKKGVEKKGKRLEHGDVVRLNIAVKSWTHPETNEVSLCKFLNEILFVSHAKEEDVFGEEAGDLVDSDDDNETSDHEEEDDN